MCIYIYNTCTSLMFVGHTPSPGEAGEGAAEVRELGVESPEARPHRSRLGAISWGFPHGDTLW